MAQLFQVLWLPVGGYHSYQACYIEAAAQIEPFSLTNSLDMQDTGFSLKFTVTGKQECVSDIVDFQCIAMGMKVPIFKGKPASHPFDKTVNSLSQKFPSEVSSSLLDQTTKWRKINVMFTLLYLVTMYVWTIECALVMLFCVAISPVQ